MDCGVLSVSNAAASPCTDTTLFDSTCVATCNAGFDANADVSTTDAASYSCAADGQWSADSSALACVEVDCGALSVGDAVVSGCSESSLSGSACVATCSTGYDADADVASTDSASYSCGADGQWAAGSSALVCVKLDCGAVSVANAASSSCTDGTLFARSTPPRMA